MAKAPQLQLKLKFDVMGLTQQAWAAHQCPVIDAQELLARHGIRPEVD